MKIIKLRDEKVAELQAENLYLKNKLKKESLKK